MDTLTLFASDLSDFMPTKIHGTFGAKCCRRLYEKKESRARSKRKKKDLQEDGSRNEKKDKGKRDLMVP